MESPINTKPSFRSSLHNGESVGSPKVCPNIVLTISGMHHKEA